MQGILLVRTCTQSGVPHFAVLKVKCAKLLLVLISHTAILDNNKYLNIAAITIYDLWF